ncbi:hypothetical protein NT239_04845 [Chitinibacter sp. SCUT-21]|uniref:capsular polysaccharide export protein, LipB/KpsS family n=1 Tax=Chitinibacter sp. SCUT-21 TaxID=2970891 RepID=UPI0035A670C6
MCFVSDESAVPSAATLVVWGMRDVSACQPRLASLIRVEDGFLRSVGLGADLIRPLSWVLDRQGIYYNSQQTSDLEQLLNEFEFDADLLQRADRLQAQILATGLTKYNVGIAKWTRPSTASCVILVPGQVESDASLAFGATGLRRNIDLLRAVRLANPHAWLIYKPHPDVVAGLRAQGADEETAAQYCDEILVDVAMGALLPLVDEVHVLTSLTGFEALLRGKRVVCYGAPFYAGWGLTQDQLTISRRTRVLSSRELFACSLLVYPSYFDRASRQMISAEQALAELQHWQKRGDAWPHWIRKLFRIILRYVVGVR